MLRHWVVREDRLPNWTIGIGTNQETHCIIVWWTDSETLFLNCHRFTVLWLEHSITVIRSSSDPCLREGQLMAVHPGPDLGHHHCHELPWCPARGSLRRPPPVLHLLLQRAVITLLHYPGELQLRAVRRPQAQGQTEPTALLHGGMRRPRMGRNPKGDGEWYSHYVKKTFTILFISSRPL